MKEEKQFLLLGDGLLKELKTKKLPKPKRDLWNPYYPKRKKMRNKAYKRAVKRIRRDFR